MSGIRNVSQNPADRQGVGLTFLGMMKRDATPSPLNPIGDYVTRIDFDNAMNLMRCEIEMLRIAVNTPWYKKMWNAIKRIF